MLFTMLHCKGKDMVRSPLTDSSVRPLMCHLIRFVVPALSSEPVIITARKNVLRGSQHMQSFKQQLYIHTLHTYIHTKTLFCPRCSWEDSSHGQ